MYFIEPGPGRVLKNEDLRVDEPRIDHLVNKKFDLPKKEEDENTDFKDYVNSDTWREESALADPNVRNVRRGETVQFERKGYYRCHKVYQGPDRPAVFIEIPDGPSRRPLLQFFPVLLERPCFLLKRSSGAWSAQTRVNFASCAKCIRRAFQRFFAFTLPQAASRRLRSSRPPRSSTSRRPSTTRMARRTWATPTRPSPPM